MVVFDEQIAIGWTDWAPVGRVYVAAGPKGVLVGHALPSCFEDYYNADENPRKEIF